MYVYERDGMGQWSQRTYVKASKAEKCDSFGSRVALSGDGETLAVGADSEASNATGIDGDQANNTSEQAGAVYIY